MMWIRTTLKWIGILLGGLVALALIAAVVINLIIVGDLNKTFDEAGSAIEITVSDEVIEEGERLARIRGCADGCHGEDSRGRVFFRLPAGSQVVAPNIARIAQEYTTEEFERVVRHGIRPDGTSVLLAMPSTMFYHLSDEDLGAIMAYLRSLDPGDEDLPGTDFNFLGRLMLFQFRMEEDTILSAEKIDHETGRLPESSVVAAERGEYLAKTVCTECHGDDLRGSPAWGMPDLVVVQAYPVDDFKTLMRTGVALGGRELELMKQVAVGRFSNFTDQEISDLHAYLQTVGSSGAAEGR